MYKSLLKVPHDRIAVFIGEHGVTRKLLEEKLTITLSINSATGDVEFSSEDSLVVYTAERVLRAIARGFTPDQALILLKDTVAFELLDLYDFLGKSHKKLVRFRSRLIGTDGKIRKKLENVSGTSIVVYGKTVGIIGDFVVVGLVRRAVEGLLSGMSHGAVLRWLKKQMNEGSSEEL